MRFIYSDDNIIDEISQKYGYLPYMVKRYLDFLGLDETISLLEANEKPLIPSIRVNTLKITVNDLKKKLEKKRFELQEISKIPYGLKILKEGQNLGSTHEYLQGYYYVQNIASMLPPLILGPNPNEIVIDMCAAPGGKSTHLAQIMKNKGKLILIEWNKNRIPSLEYNLRRMGVKNSIILNFDSKNLEKLDIQADKILLDAPCTGEGLIKEDKTRKKSKTLNDIKKISKIQEKLLEAGLKSLKANGELIYSTCSIAPEENEFVINKILQKLDGFSIKKIPETYGVKGFTEVFKLKMIEDLKYSQRLYPHHYDTIGFYFCLIKRI